MIGKAAAASIGLEPKKRFFSPARRLGAVRYLQLTQSAVLRGNYGGGSEGQVMTTCEP